MHSLDDAIKRAALAQPHPALQQLLQAKAESDRRNYAAKADIMRKLMSQAPHDFFIDSEQNDVYGITHRPTGFKLHLPKTSVPSGMQQTIKVAEQTYSEYKCPKCGGAAFDGEPPDIKFRGSAACIPCGHTFSVVGKDNPNKKLFVCEHSADEAASVVREHCPSCGARQERGDNGDCNRCGKPWPIEKAAMNDRYASGGDWQCETCLTPGGFVYAFDGPDSKCPKCGKECDRRKMRKQADLCALFPFLYEGAKQVYGAHSEQDTRDVRNADVSDLGRDAESVQQQKIASVSSLRRARDKDLPTMDEVREFPGGHGGTPGRHDHRANQEQSGLFAGQLSLAAGESAATQSAKYAADSLSRAVEATHGMGNNAEHSAAHAVQSHLQVEMADSKSVYDKTAKHEYAGQDLGTRRSGAEHTAMGAPAGNVGRDHPISTTGWNVGSKGVIDAGGESRQALQSQEQYRADLSGETPVAFGLGRAVAGQLPYTLHAMAAGQADSGNSFAKQGDLLPTTQLQPHQQTIAQQAGEKQEDRKLLYHSLGSGKTLSSLAAAETARQPYAAIVPAALRNNFQGERQRFTDMTTPSSVVSYNTIATGHLPLNHDTVIFDESHRLRNPDSLQTQHAKQLASMANRVYLLSGSPIINHPSDLATMVEMLTKQPMTPDEFTQRFIREARVNPSFLQQLRGITPGVELQPKNEKQLRKMLTGHVDYFAPPKADVDVREETIPVEMADDQANLYKAFWGQIPWWVRAKLRNNFPLSKSELKRLTAFMSGPRQVGLSTLPFRRGEEAQAIKAFDASPKLQTAFNNLKKQLDSNPEARAAVFSNYIDAGLSPYAAALQRAGIQHGIFTGKNSDAQRQKMIDDYNSGRSRVLLLGPAGSEGLSLKGTRLIQLLDPHWHETRLIQNIGRGVRYDSHSHLPPDQRNVLVQRYMATLPLSFRQRMQKRLFGGSPEETADEYIRRLAAKKQELNQRFLGLLQDIGSQKQASASEKDWNLMNIITALEAPE